MPVSADGNIDPVPPTHVRARSPFAPAPGTTEVSVESGDVQGPSWCGVDSWNQSSPDGPASHSLGQALGVGLLILASAGTFVGCGQSQPASAVQAAVEPALTTEGLLGTLVRGFSSGYSSAHQVAYNLVRAEQTRHEFSPQQLSLLNYMEPGLSSSYSETVLQVFTTVATHPEMTQIQGGLLEGMAPGLLSGNYGNYVAGMNAILVHPEITLTQADVLKNVAGRLNSSYGSDYLSCLVGVLLHPELQDSQVRLLAVLTPNVASSYHDRYQMAFQETLRHPDLSAADEGLLSSLAHQFSSSYGDVSSATFMAEINHIPGPGVQSASQ